MIGSAEKNRVGRETGTTGIFLGLNRNDFLYVYRTVGKHSVHRRYNIKTAGQSSSQGKLECSS
jgi:hypothetical protein